VQLFCFLSGWEVTVIYIHNSTWYLTFFKFFPFSFHSLPWRLTVSDCYKMSCGGLQLLFQILVFCPYKFTFKDDRTTYQMLFLSLVYNGHWNNDLSLTVHWEPIAYCEFQFSFRMFRQTIAMHSRYIYIGSYCCLNCSKKIYSPEVETWNKTVIRSCL